MESQKASLATQASSRKSMYRVVFVASISEAKRLRVSPDSYQHGSHTVVVDRVDPQDFSDYLDSLAEDVLTGALFISENGAIPKPLQVIRSRQELRMTRVYLLTCTPNHLVSYNDLDVEDVIDLTRLTPVKLGPIIESAVRGYQALSVNPLLPRY